MTEFRYKDLSKMNYTQDDGAIWTAFSDNNNPDKRFFIVTSSGKELFLGNKDLPYKALKRMFGQYRDAEITKDDSIVREFLGEGAQAQVYGLGPRLAVRETPGNLPFYKTLGSISRMDRLATVVENGVPRWINVPHTYAIYSDTEAHKQYTLMDKIDSGVTIQDMVGFDEATKHSQERVLKEFGHRPTEREAADAARLFDEAGRILTNAIVAQGSNPDELLTDWFPRNVIIEQKATPVGGERYLLSVIDQIDQN